MMTGPSSLTVIHRKGSEFLIAVAIEALAAKKQQFEVSGVSINELRSIENGRPRLRTHGGIIINARSLDSPLPGGEVPDGLFDYEYLYTEKHFSRRDFVRFISFILGQSRPNDEIFQKGRSAFLSLTFPDVNDALPNLEIVSIGADVLELRVDLLREKGFEQGLPRLDYVAKQMLALRRRTELPIIFTIRFDDSAGRWPLSADHVAHTYLRKALQWGVEYIDVATSFAEDIKADLVSRKGSTFIIASHHDLRGGLKWSTPIAEQIFSQCCLYGDVVEMVGLATCQKDNYDLLHFRSNVQNSTVPLIAINTGIEGRFSRVLNRFLTPIKHPLLPQAASPSQLSAAEINKDLAVMGEIKKKAIYTFAFKESYFSPPPQFFEKCFNELSLPHMYTNADSPSISALSTILGSPDFGGAVSCPAISANAALFATLTSSAAATGFVDTIYVRDGKLAGHNAAAKGILHTLIRDSPPSAYVAQPVLIVSHSFQAVAAAIHALQSLHCGKVYTVGFRIPSASTLANNTEHCLSLNFRSTDVPFVVVSALDYSEAQLLAPLLSLIVAHDDGDSRRMFLDIGNKRVEQCLSANGVITADWIINDVEEVAAWTAVEMMKYLVGQSVPYGFVRMASKKGFF